MRDFLEQPADFHLNPKFLAEFAGQALLEGFTRLTFAPGEFPKAAQM